MSSDRYRDKGDSQNRYGSGRREGRGVDNRTGYSGQIRQPWEPEQSEREESGSYRTQHAQPQGDGEPYEDNGRDRLSGGPARRSDEGERWPSAGGRSMGGSRSFDGRDRGPQNQSHPGGGYGEFNYRDEDSPRGRSMLGGDGQAGAGFGRIGDYGTTLGDMARGRFTGKGPKGYQRSDDRIREDVSDVLERHGEIDASDIEVHVQSGEVTLAGTVHDRFAKRLAEDVIENLSGIKQVHNRLRVGGAVPEKQNAASSKSNLGKPSGSMRQS
jgi:hypothetical protein